MIVAALAILALLQQPNPAVEGRELIHKVIRRAETAKTLRLETKSELNGGPQGNRTAHLVLTLRGRDEFRAVLVRDTLLIRIKSDGKTIVNTGRAQVDPKRLDPANLVDWIRYRAAVAAYEVLDFLQPSALEAGMPPIDKAVVEGEEKIGSVTAKIVAYSLPVPGQPRVTAVRAWIDPEKLVVLKREVKLGAMVLNEIVTVMEYDAAVDGDDFAIVSPSELRRAQERRIAESVELYARWLGKRPAALADLGTPPSGEKYWPDGGFWIGGKIAGDVPKGSATGSAIVFPSDRLAKLFTAHVRLKLLRAAVDAYEGTYWRLPTSFADLLKKPEGAAIWPEGGFILDAGFLKDPWEQEYQFVPRRGAVVIRCAGFNEHRVLEEDLTREERLMLIESLGTPIPADKLAALPYAKLGDPDPAVREAARAEFLALGPGVLGAVEARLAKENPADVRSGLQSIRDRLWNANLPWRDLLSAPREIAYGDSPGRTHMNERVVRENLAEIFRAQTNFKTKDPDDDHAANYWVADVAGIFATGLDHAPERPGVFFARADATPGRREYKVLEGLTEPEPFIGSYLAASLRHFEEAPGKRARYDDGKGRNPDRFGVVVFPDAYGVSGILTFIIDQTGAKWSKDLGGAEIDTFPHDPAAAGWQLVQ